MEQPQLDLKLPNKLEVASSKSDLDVIANPHVSS